MSPLDEEAGEHALWLRERVDDAATRAAGGIFLRSRRARQIAGALEALVDRAGRAAAALLRTALAVIEADPSTHAGPPADQAAGPEDPPIRTE